MALSIKNQEANRLARELAALTGESLTETIVLSLRERLERQRASQDNRPDWGRWGSWDTRWRGDWYWFLGTAYGILGYNENGLPS